MKVKRFRAEDRATALKQIRTELGADAVIVAENRVRTGGVFGMFGKVEVEILAALEDRPPVAAGPRASVPAPRPPAGGRPGEVEATISSAARRVAATNAVPPAPVPMDGAGRLAAILAEMPRTGGGVSPEMTSRLADLLAQGGHGGGVATSGASGGALPSAPRPVPAAPPAPSATPRGGAIGPSGAGIAGSGAPTAVQERPVTPAASPAPPPAPVPVAEVRPGDVAPVREPGAAPDAGGPAGGAVAAPRPSTAFGSQVVAPLVPPATVATSLADGAVPAAPPDADGAPPAAFRDMQHTLSDLRASVDRLMRQQQVHLWPRDLPVVRTIYQHLVAQELDGQLSLEVVGQVSDEINEGRPADPAAVLARVRELIAARIRVGRVARVPGAPTVIVLVGPTGVGKTTTLAKLAAHLSMQENRRVALVTTDTFRIAAASQLGTYADLMELPLEVAYSPEELRAAVDRQSNADYVLVDSPGCAQRNDAQIRELAAFVGTLPGATVLLTVAATVKLRDLVDIQEGFGVLPLGGLVLTKLDETNVFGPAMSLVARGGENGTPVYYMTSGQNVPTDLEEASLDRLADLVTGQLLEAAMAGSANRGGAARELVGAGGAR